MGDVMARKSCHDDEVRLLAASRAADLIAGIGCASHDEARRDAGVRASHTLTQILELLLLGVLIDRVAGGESQLLGSRNSRHAYVMDEELGAGGTRDADRVVKCPFGCRGEVGWGQNATPGVHDLLRGHLRAPRARPD